MYFEQAKEVDEFFHSKTMESYVLNKLNYKENPYEFSIDPYYIGASISLNLFIRYYNYKSELITLTLNKEEFNEVYKQYLLELGKGE